MRIAIVSQEPSTPKSDGHYFGQSSRMLPYIFEALGEFTEVLSLSMQEFPFRKDIAKIGRDMAKNPIFKPSGKSMLARAWNNWDLIEKRYNEFLPQNIDALVIDVRAIAMEYDFYLWTLVKYYLPSVKRIYAFDGDDLFALRAKNAFKENYPLVKDKVTLVQSAHFKRPDGIEVLPMRWFIHPHLNRYKTTDFPEFDIAYGGYDYGRRNLFKKYLTGLNPEFPDKNIIMGKWPGFPERFPNLKFAGQVGLTTVHETYNDSLGVIHLFRNRYARIGMNTGRLWEVAGSRTLPFIPAEYPLAECWVPNHNLIVSSAQELQDKIKFYKQNPSERSRLIDANYEMYKNDSPRDTAQLIFNHLNK